MVEDFWKHYTSSQLEIEVGKNPLTKEGLYAMGKTHNIEVIFLQMDSPENRGFTMFCGCENSIPEYHILINDLITEEEQRATLAHELVHVYYRCGSTILGLPGDKKVEEIIERETSRLISSFPSFIDWIFRSVSLI